MWVSFIVDEVCVLAAGDAKRRLGRRRGRVLAQGSRR